MLAPLFDEVEERFSVYVFEFRQLLKLQNLPIGGQEALPALANSLTKSPDLRLNLGRMTRAVIRREREQISSVELLAVLLRALGQSAAEHATAQSESAVEELLGFILEVRYRHGAGEENKSPFVRPVKDGEEVTPRRVAFVEPTRNAPAAPLFQETEDVDTGSRKRIMLVAACAAVFGLGIPLALHQHGASQKSGAPVAEGRVASGISEQAASTIHGTAAARHRGWLSGGKIRLRGGDAAAPAVSDAGTPDVASSPVLPTKSVVRTGVGASRSVQPVQPGMKNAYAAEAPLASDGAVAESTHRVITPVDLRSASSREAVGRTGGPGFVHAASAGIMAGNVTSSPSPTYPAEALSAGVQGEVTVRAVVGPDGNVTEARVVSGPPLLRQAALQAVEQWQYRPYLVDGRPAAMGTTAIVEFKLPGA